MLVSTEEFDRVEDDAIKQFDELFPVTIVPQFVPYYDAARSIFGWESDHDQSDDVDTFSMARLHVLCLQLSWTNIAELL